MLYYKRLEKGTFELPDIKQEGCQITWSQLMLIIEGIRVEAFEKRARFIPDITGCTGHHWKNWSVLTIRKAVAGKGRKYF